MECLQRWRFWIRPLVVSVYFVLLTIALPLMIWEFYRNHTMAHVQAWFIGGFFVVMAVPISLWGILQHLVHYSKPFLQRHIIRILWMVPIYAMNAWLALRFKDAAIYLDTMRECYEAYVIYNFMTYLMNFLRHEHLNIEDVVASKEQVNHFIPFCLLRPWTMGSQLIHRCRHGVLQYTVVRPITTMIALICALCGVYDEGDFNFTSAWSYLAIINNISQVWAMYCLVLFYRATKEELAPSKPVAKFICVKAVVFLSFWQAVLIAMLVKVGVIKDSQGWFSVKEVATGIQDFCICIEMFFAAIAHYYSFSHTPFINPALGEGNCCASFMSMWDVSDVRADVVEHVRHVRKTVTRPLMRGMRGTYENERQPLLQEEDSPVGPQAGSSRYTVNSAGESTYSTTPTLHSPAIDHNSERPYIEDQRGLLTPDTASIHTMESSTSTNITVENFGAKRSLTSSMNNFAPFGESVETDNTLVDLGSDNQTLVKIDTPEKSTERSQGGASSTSQQQGNDKTGR